MADGGGWQWQLCVARRWRKQAGRTVAVASAPNTGAAGKTPRSARTLQAIVRRAGPPQAAEAQQAAGRDSESEAGSGRAAAG